MRHDVATFLKGLNVTYASVNAGQMDDLYCMARYDSQGKMMVVLVIAPMVVLDHIACVIHHLAVSEKHRGEGLGRAAICQLREFLLTQKGKIGRLYLQGIYMMLGMTRKKQFMPHEFWKKLGFQPGLPGQFACWAAKDLDMAY